MRRKKSDVITFKVDEALLEAMKGIENRSGFIRSAILSALDNTCPLCRGTGKLSPDQLTHWRQFAIHHSLTECADCSAVILQCDHTGHDCGHSHESKGERQS